MTRWTACPGFEKYEVSDDGLFRIVETGRVLKYDVNSDGYNTVHFIIQQVDGSRKKLHKKSARLVAEAWLGRPPEDFEVNHKDSNRANDRVENLEWVCKSQNILHAYRHGRLTRKGEKNSCAKLNESDVSRIKEMLRNGVSQKETAARFGVDPSNISCISSGKTWGWVK